MRYTVVLTPGVCWEKRIEGHVHVRRASLWSYPHLECSVGVQSALVWNTATCSTYIRNHSVVVTVSSRGFLVSGIIQQIGCKTRRRRRNRSGLQLWRHRLTLTPAGASNWQQQQRTLVIISNQYTRVTKMSAMTSMVDYVRFDLQ